MLGTDISVFARTLGTAITQGISIMRTSNTALIILSIVLYYASIMAYVFRWRIVIKKIGYRVKLTTLMLINASSIFVNNVTPLNRAGGEPLRALWLAAIQRISKARAFVTLVYERYTELVPVTTIVLLALVTRATPLHSHGWVSLVILVLALLGLAIMGFNGELLTPIIFKVLGRKSIRSSLQDTRNAFQLMMKDKGLFARTLALSSTVWVMELLRLWLIGLSVGVRFSITDLIYVDAVYIVSGILAVTPGGLGIVDGSLVAILSSLGIGLDKAIAITIIERLISYGLATITGGLAMLAIGGRALWRHLKSQ